MAKSARPKASIWYRNGRVPAYAKMNANGVTPMSVAKKYAVLLMREKSPSA